MSKKKKKPSSGKAPNNTNPQSERCKAKAQRRKARKKAKLKREEELAPIEQDGTFAFIAGYTDNGVPFGTTWEELGLEPFASTDELLEAYDRYGAGLVDDDFDFDGTDDDQQGYDSWEDPDGYPVDPEKHEPSWNVVLEDIDDVDIDDVDIDALPF